MFRADYGKGIDLIPFALFLYASLLIASSSLQTPNINSRSWTLELYSNQYELTL
jgi:hypothetical protein